MMPDSQHGDQKIVAVSDTATYTDGARIVRLEEIVTVLHGPGKIYTKGTGRRVAIHR